MLAHFILLLLSLNTNTPEPYKLSEFNFARILAFNAIGSHTLVNYFGKTPGDLGLFLYDLENESGYFLDRNKIRAMRTNIAILDDQFLVCNLISKSAPIFFLIDKQGQLIKTIRVANFDTWQAGFNLQYACSYDAQRILINFTDLKRPDKLIIATFDPLKGILIEQMTTPLSEKTDPVVLFMNHKLWLANKLTGAISQRSSDSPVLAITPGVPPVQARSSMPLSKARHHYQNILFGFHAAPQRLLFEYADYYDTSGEVQAQHEKKILSVLANGEVSQDSVMLLNQTKTKRLVWHYPDGDLVVEAL